MKTILSKLSSLFASARAAVSWVDKPSLQADGFWIGANCACAVLLTIRGAFMAEHWSLLIAPLNAYAAVTVYRCMQRRLARQRLKELSEEVLLRVYGNPADYDIYTNQHEGDT